MKIINGINPLASGIDWLGVPDLAEFWRDHAPANADVGGQRCVWLSRADCSVEPPERVAKWMSYTQDERDPGTARNAAGWILNSFCPIATVKHLVEKVKLPRDFAGVIATDHEIPAWMSCLHSSVYNDLRNAINEVFPFAGIAEYAGIRTDWVMGWNKEDRSHELAAMDRTASCGPLAPMMSLYVPGWEYIKDRVRFKDMVERNVNRALAEGFGHDDQTFAISPIIEGTYKNGDYTSGDVVPVEVMRIILQAIADAGAAAVLWGAAKDDEQAGRLLRAVNESVVKAAEGVK